MSDKEKYMAYCRQHQVPLFFKPFWLDGYDAAWDVLYASTYESSAFFIYQVEKKLHFRIIRNGMLNPYTGFLFSDSEAPLHIRQTLAEMLIQKLPAADEISIDFHPSIGLDIPFRGLPLHKKITNILSISEPENLYKQYKASLKRQINKAQKLMHVEEKNEINLLYRLYEKTFAKQNIPVALPFTAFEKVWKICVEHQCGKLLFAIDRESAVHAALLLVYDDDTAYYLAGGTDAQFYGSGAMSFLMHKAIETAYALGKKYFDFEGSMLPNVNRFFSAYNPSPVPYLSGSTINSPLLKAMKQLKKR